VSEKQESGPLERNKAVVGDEDERCYLNGEVKGEIWLQVWCDALADGNGVAGLARREWRLIEIVGDWGWEDGKVEVRCMTRQGSGLFLAFDVVGVRLLLTVLDNLMMSEEVVVCSVRCLIRDHVPYLHPSCRGWSIFPSPSKLKPASLQVYYFSCT